MIVIDSTPDADWRAEYRALRAAHPDTTLVRYRHRPRWLAGDALGRLAKASAACDGLAMPIPAAWLGDDAAALDDAAFARAASTVLPIDLDPPMWVAAPGAGDALHLCDHVVADIAAAPMPNEIAPRLTLFAIAPLPSIRPARDDKPVILHLLHGWGGGAARFVRDLASADADRAHLLLQAVSCDGRYGTALRLIDAANGAALRQWPLQPTIADIDVEHAGYRALLNEICEAYNVEQLWVSSLIGHALDALDSDLPVRWIAHDALPFWPGLDIDFLNPAQRFDDDALVAALAARGPFRGGAVAHWSRLRAEATARLLKRSATLIAPSESARRQLLRVAPELQSLPTRVIAHGLAPLPRIDFHPAARGKLKLVVIGRLQSGKGADFLRALLPQLLVHADVYLLGAGKAAHAFFGQRGVHIVLDYRRERLPELIAQIAPHAALFPGTVSETFSYALSEALHLGVPPIAQAVGAFAERIDIGLLLAPDPRAWIDAIAALDKDRSTLASWRETLLARTPRTLREMYAAYVPLLPPGRRAPLRYRIRPWTPADATLLMAEFETARAQAAERAAQQTIAAQQRELDTRGAWGFSLQRQLDERTRWAQSLRQELDAQTALREHAERDRRLSEHEHRARQMLIEARLYEAQSELRRAQDHFNEQAKVLNEDLRQLRHDHEALRAENRRLATLEMQLSAERDRLLGIKQTLEHDRSVLLTQREELLSSTSWRLTSPIRAISRWVRDLRTTLKFRLARAGSAWQRFRGSLARRGLRPTLQRAARELKDMQRQAPSAPAFAPPAVDPDYTPFALPTGSPRVSIIVPVYNQLHFTWNALKAIADVGADAPFEVIVVDDGSSDDTRARVPTIIGVRYHRNEQNLGFIGACNAGAALASGEYLVFLNNDTAVQRGWLDALLSRAMQPGVGLVGAKLIYPDGRLQEAGGIVFDDGSGWNYGRFEHPDDPRYDFPRQVDYCSGAAILIGKALFDKLGGFDAHYAPAYYEDTDLAFKIRAHGLQVWFEPAARVVHYEGISSGTDVTQGTKRFQLVNQQKFAQRWRDALANQPAPVERDAIVSAALHRAAGRVLLIDANTPEPDQDSGSVRYINLIRVFQSLGWQVTFFADNRAYLPGYTERLRALGVEVLFHPWLTDPVAFFKQRGAEFDVVMVSRHYVARHYLALVREHAPRAKLIFDTVDLHFLREQRAAQIAASEALERSSDATKAAELELVRKCDVTLVVSPFEQQLLAGLAPAARVDVLSNIHDVAGRRSEFSARKDFWFIGGFQHQPNVDAMLWFVSEVWPAIRERLPDALFHIVGSKMPDSVAALAGNGVIAHGFVDNVERFLDGCRVAVAPLRFGAGVKGKVNQSMAYGQPVVATTLAVEGMAIAHEAQALVADDAHVFAIECVRLYSNEALWLKLSDAALANIEQHFSFAAAREALRGVLG